MSTFPITRGTSQALYPFTRTLSFLTDVHQFNDGSQQRSVIRPNGPICSFDLQYSAFAQSDKDAIKTAILAAKGQQATTISISLGGVTYANLSLESDVFEAVERKPTQYEMSIKFRGTAAQSLTAAGSGSTFPTFSYGTTSQLPYSQGHRFSTQAKGGESGDKYTYAFWSTALKQWTLEFPIMADADVTILEQHFLWAQGRFQAFTFVDPDDATSNALVHYASDDLAIIYNSPNSASVRVALEQTR
jgi:hypothetical protein